MTRSPRRCALAQKQLEIFERAVDRMNRPYNRDIVAVVAQGRRIERQEPERSDTEIVQIIELFGQTGEIADAIGVAVGKGAHVQFINDRVFVPERMFR